MSHKVFDSACVMRFYWLKLVRESELMGKREKRNIGVLVCVYVAEGWGGGLGVSRRDYPSVARIDLGMSESMC